MQLFSKLWLWLENLFTSSLYVVISLISSMSPFKPCCDYLLFNVFCFIFRRKTKTQSNPSRSKPWTSTTASPYAIQGPYAFSDITKLPHTGVDSSMPADIMTKYPSAPPQDSQCDDYENVSCAVRESGFVTNDIYETCKTQSQRQTGWVENEIYG